MGEDKQKVRSFCNNRRWGMESKAFVKSKSIRIVTLESCIVCLMSFVTAVSAVSVL